MGSPCSSLACCFDDGKQLIVATHEDNSHANAAYRLHREIETLFGCQKGSGFRFEDKHITGPERIQKMVTVLAIAFEWAHRIGGWRDENTQAIKLKKHGRRAISLFRYGLDFIHDLLFIGKFSAERYRQCLHHCSDAGHF